ncbi:MAG: hypothetical protein KatS3mg077_2418 [Candidatus Binatia bacterium]|nr:MAG: hypothetical protein KatS3mg077_2418 [Candidatus Binatia bacterium]
MGRQPIQPHPVEVRREAGGQILQITWSDGHVSRYPWRYLRGWCPCAQCQGHEGTRSFQHCDTAELDRVFAVGRYALGFRWHDGHETGIYTYVYLREICPCCRADAVTS